MVYKGNPMIISMDSEKILNSTSFLNLKTFNKKGFSGHFLNMCADGLCLAPLDSLFLRVLAGSLIRSESLQTTSFYLG